MATYNRDFANWIVGFTDGEGSFSIKFELSQANIVRFVFTIVQKELRILEEIREFFGFGHIYERSNGMGFSFETGKRDDIIQLVKFFREFPLRSQKQIDFEIWAECFEMTKANERKSNELLTLIAEKRMGMINGALRSKYFQTPEEIHKIISKRR